VSESVSYLDTPKVREFITERVNRKPSPSNRSLAEDVQAEFGVPTSEKSIRRAKRRWGLAEEGERRPQTERPRFTKTNDDRAEIVSEPTPISDTNPEDLIRQHGLDPDEWDITNVKVNRWNGMMGKARNNELAELCQLTIQLVRRKPTPPFLEKAQPQLETYRRPLPKYGENDKRVVVFAGDQQAPFHDATLHELFCQWLETNQPGEGILIGDTVDFPDISRHRYNPERTATVQQCVNAGYTVLKDYRDAALHTDWTLLPGNHDERIRNTLIDWSVELYGVTKAQVEGDEQEPPVLSVESLLRLNELAIRYEDPNGQYDQAQVNLSEYLAARHGWLAVKGSGASALKTLEHLGYSIVVGHTHRQSVVYQTKHNINGKPTTLVGVETGCMCSIDGLGYSVAPDWQQGFATATIWPDGVFKIDLATYFDGTLVWRDQRYGD
jgi:hypothetical protein